jgi:O-antigen/teichoic acid export membrane protein
MTWRIVIATLTVAAAVAVLSVAGQAVPSVAALAALLAVAQLDVILDLGLASMRVVGAYRSAASWRMARRLLYVAVVVLAVLAGAGVTGVALAVLGAAIPFALLTNTHALRPRRDRNAAAVLSRQGARMFWASGVLYWIYFQADQVLLALFSKRTELGMYAPAVAVASIALMLTTVVAEVVLPRLFSFGVHEQRDDQVRERTLPYVPLFAALAGLLLVGFVFFGGEAARLVFGPEFARTGTLLAILGGFVAARYLALPAYLAAQALDRLRAVIVLQSIAAAVNVVANVALIPRWGAKGSAIATLGSETLMLVGVWGLVPRTWVRPAVRLARPFVIGAAIATGAGLLMGDVAKLAIALAYLTGVAVLVRPQLARLRTTSTPLPGPVDAEPDPSRRLR